MSDDDDGLQILVSLHYVSMFDAENDIVGIISVQLKTCFSN